MDQPTVLVVNEPKIREIVWRYLQAGGTAVAEQADGPSALRAALHQPPDLIVLDVMLRGLDGVEALHRLRATSQVPVILLTARDEEIDKFIWLTAGRRRLPHQTFQRPRTSRPCPYHPPPRQPHLGRTGGHRTHPIRASAYRPCGARVHDRESELLSS